MPAPLSRPVPDVETLLAHSPYVRALARELVFDAALARDVEQETWLAALEQAPSDPGALRGWLAALVHNIARKAWRSAARRRTRELAHAREGRAELTPAEVLEHEELRRLVVEELNALDEPYRSALVLRYLQGLEPPEVARRLGVPLETVRTRLKRGLELLRARLDRTSRGERRAWCLALVQGLRLAPPGAGRLALAIVSHSLSGVTGVLAMSLFAACGMLFFLSRPGAPVEPVARTSAALAPSAPLADPGMEPWPIVPAASWVYERVAVPVSTQARATSDDTVKVAGRVLDPDGKPLSGAEVLLTRWHWDERYPRDPLATTRSDGEGRFALSYSKSDPRLAVDAERPEMWRRVVVSAYAPGFGLAWEQVGDVPDGGEAVLTLVHDVTVRGRVLDLEGQPVAGARFRVQYISATPAPESLDGFLENPATGSRLLTRYFQPSTAHEITCETGPDGSFELFGIGRERSVTLDVRGPTIAHATLRVATRPIETLTWNSGDMMALNETLFGSELEWVAPPTRPVTGIVRDAATHEPLAGVKVAGVVTSGIIVAANGAATTTGPDGRFRLIGLPKLAGNSIHVVPNDEQPYFMQDLELPDPGGMTPVEVEIGLHRGVWITGRVTERGTGKPAYGHILYMPYLDNPHAQKLKEFDSDLILSAQLRYKPDADGRFRIVGLPGRAIVGVAAIGAYRQGVGAEAIEGASAEGTFPTYGNPAPAGRTWPTAMRAVEIPAEASTTVCDLELDRGETLAVELVDPQEKPLEHCKVTGRASRASYLDADDVGPRVEVINLAPDERRLLRIHHEEPDLGLAVFVSLGDESKAVLRLKLEPCATIVGRLLDQGGAPIANAPVHLSNELPWSRAIRTDGEGRFRIEHVVPGLDVEVWTDSSALDPDASGSIGPKFAVEAGATKDLGDVRLKVR